MSASPANSAAPGARPPMRKKPPVNIFNSRKKPAMRPVQRPPPQNQNQASNGARPNPPQQLAQPSTNGAAALPQAQADEGLFEDYPIFIAKNTTTATGQRYHALKLHSRPDQNGNTVLVSPFDETQFTQPLRLHRRFARDKMETAEMSDAAGDDDKEREIMNARRAERQAEREENQKLIAPTGGDSTKPQQKKKPQKKVEEGRDDSNPIRKKKQQLRYEESRPWHLEDFEGKNIWVGSYEQALSERSIMLVLDQAQGGFRMVPIEKWYRFIETNKVKSMDPEEAEKMMQKKFGMSRWGLKTQAGNEESRREAHQRAQAARREQIEEANERQMFGDGEFNADRDMLDMDFKDEFQDDDEGILFQGEEGEEAEDIEKKIWLEQQGAGLGGTGVKNEDIDPEEDERKRQEEEQQEKEMTKQLRKQLMKKEHQVQYGEDSDEIDSSSEEEDEERRKKEEEEKKQEEARKAAQANGDKSGASTRGTTTPSGRPEKRLASSLDASDQSGNESSRKKVKSSNGTAASSSAPGSGRSLSPDMAKTKIARSTGGSGSGSDTETSRGRPKIRIKNSPPGSPSNATPNGSRAASPANGSRAQSPKANGAAKNFPTLEEVRAAIPPGGVEIKTLVGMFKQQVAGRSTDFISLVKAAGTQDKASGKIMPKAT